MGAFGSGEGTIDAEEERCGGTVGRDANTLAALDGAFARVILAAPRAGSVREAFETSETSVVP